MQSNEQESSFFFCCTRRWVALLVLSLGWATGSHGASSPAPLSTIRTLDQANAAVVGVSVTAAEGARSAATLGAQRQGSGVVIGPEGLVLTIGYLMLEAQQIEITTRDKRTLPAVAVAYDSATGFGLVRPLLPLRGIQPVRLGSLQTLQTGQPLLAAVGASADGQDADVSMTSLVSQRAFSGSWEYHIDAALFTSPPVTAGNGNHSGAALFNDKGELLGIGSLLVMDAAGQNRRMPGNMFVPVDLLKPILAELQRTGSSRQSHRPWLGINSTDQRGRVEVLRVNDDSPAQLAGLKAGDVVLAVDDTRVSTLEAFYKKLWARETPETPVKLTVMKGADVQTLVLTPRDRLQSLQKPAGI